MGLVGSVIDEIVQVCRVAFRTLVCVGKVKTEYYFGNSNTGSTAVYFTLSILPLAATKGLHLGSLTERGKAHS